MAVETEAVAASQLHPQLASKVAKRCPAARMSAGTGWVSWRPTRMTEFARNEVVPHHAGLVAPTALSLTASAASRWPTHTQKE